MPASRSRASPFDEFYPPSHSVPSPNQSHGFCHYLRNPLALVLKLFRKPRFPCQLGRSQLRLDSPPYPRPFPASIRRPWLQYSLSTLLSSCLVLSHYQLCAPVRRWSLFTALSSTRPF